MAIKHSGRRTLIFGGALLAAVLVVLIAAYVYDQSQRNLIAPGIRIAGLNVGGLRAPAARTRLRAELQRVEADLITIRYGRARFTLTGAEAHLSVDVGAAVGQALSQSRGGWFLSRAVRGLLGGHVNREIPLAVNYSQASVANLIARIRSAIDRPMRDASVSVDGSAHLVTVHSQAGVTADVATLQRELAEALRAPAVPHVLTLRVRTFQPKVTTAMVAAQNPAYIVVDRPQFKLFLYQHLRLTHTYPIAVGRAGLETPAGLHHILDKQVNPSWHVPHSTWAGRLAGKVIPPGPQDPLVARWMAIDDLGDGIHGTNEPWSIGSAASHGCIRMLVPDVIQLYSLAPLGAPVYVV